MRRARLLIPVVFLATSACGSSGSSLPDSGDAHDAAIDRASPRVDAGRETGAPSDASTHDTSPVSDALANEGGVGDAASCHGTSAAADRPRKVVISHPFDQAQNDSSDFEVFDLDETGAITQPNVHFSLGPTTMGTVVFTPDGTVGLVAEDDGTLGVFRFDMSGAPVVVSASLTGSFYADSVVMDPSGARAYVFDDQTTSNGGGIYTVGIACDGTVTDLGLLVSANLPATVLPLGTTSAVVLANGVRGVPVISDAGPDAPASTFHDGGPVPGNDAVLVSWPGAANVLGTADPFGDDLAIISAGALTQDGRYVLIGDNSQFSGIPNRVGVVSVSSAGIAAAGVVENVNDPEALIASPFDDTILVSSGFGNAFFVLAATPASEAGAGPFTMSTLTYDGPPPQLPGQGVMIARGSLLGRVLVAENQAIRQVQFAKGGVVTDLGGTATGSSSDIASIVGAIGVQP